MSYDIPAGIRLARHANGYTQQELAKLINVSKETLSNYENGKTIPDMMTLIKMSEVCHCTVDRLLMYHLPNSIKTPDDESKFNEFRKSSDQIYELQSDELSNVTQHLDKIVKILEKADLT